MLFTFGNINLIQRFLLSCYKGIYKRYVVTPLFKPPYAFIYPAKIYSNPRVYMNPFEELCGK